MCLLIIFELYVYRLLDPITILSFVTPYVSIGFDILPYVLLKPFSVSTLVGDSIMTKRVYRKHPVSLSHSVTHVDLAESPYPIVSLMLILHRFIC